MTLTADLQRAANPGLLGSATTNRLGLHILRLWGEEPMETPRVMVWSEHKAGGQGLMEPVLILAKPF